MNNLTVVGIQKDCPDCEGLPCCLTPCYICYGFGWYFESFFPKQKGLYGTTGAFEQATDGHGDGGVEDRPNVSEEDWGGALTHSLLDYQDCIQRRDGRGE